MWHGGCRSSRVQQSYGLRDESVLEPGGVGPDAPVPSAGRRQTEQFVTGVAGVSGDPVGLPPALLGVEMFHDWQLRPDDVLCCSPPSVVPCGGGWCNCHTRQDPLSSAPT